jgi:lipase ATG15
MVWLTILLQSLRHIYHHGSAQMPQLHRYLDVHPETEFEVTADYGNSYEPAPKDLHVQMEALHIQRLANRRRSATDKLFDYAKLHGTAMSLSGNAWTTDEVAGPNVTSKQTIVTFAKIAANAYVTKAGTGDWKDVKGGFNYTDDFGWQQDGLRGHIFADEQNKTIVIGLKGTSPAVFDGTDTTGNDKLNDNLFGSCCCAQGGPFLWKQVCDCSTKAYTCNNTCLVKSLQEKGHYYFAVRDLYHNVTERYPNSDVWLSGHSLGGVVSSLLGLTYGLPTLTFEAFPDAMAASRLGLPTPPGYSIGSHQSRADTGIYHIGHTADPIFMGVCNEPTSFCTIAGYAFQGVCHTGKTCVYDTVKDLGWRVGIGTHKISNVIHDVLDKYDTVPKCDTDVDCSDCFNWTFFESNGTESTTTSSTSSHSKTSSSTITRTRTETCKHPGWWGCDDPITTTSASTPLTTITSRYTTTTCINMGWFGCRDDSPVTTTISTTITSTLPLPSSTTSGVTATTITTTTTICQTACWFGGCCDEDDSKKGAKTSTQATPAPSVPTSTPAITSSPAVAATRKFDL